ALAAALGKANIRLVRGRLLLFKQRAKTREPYFVQPRSMARIQLTLDRSNRPLGAFDNNRTSIGWYLATGRPLCSSRFLISRPDRLTVALMRVLSRRALVAGASASAMLGLAGCASTPTHSTDIDPAYRRTEVQYATREPRGTIVVD